MAQRSVNRLTVPSVIPRYRVCLVPESRQAGPVVLIRDSSAAAAALRPFFTGLDREQFLVCCLDAKHAIIGVNVVSIGSLTLSIVHPREVFRPALIANAAAIVVLHNHPSGDATPSEADIKVTRDLIRAGQLLKMELIDHVVVGNGNFSSLRSLGYFYQ